MTDSPRCADPRQGRFLAAYEMNLLAPQERESFESHLERCPACLEDLYAFSGYAATLCGHPHRVLEQIDRPSSQPALVRTERTTLLGLVRMWGRFVFCARVLVPATIVAVLCLVLLQQYSPRGVTSGEYAGLAQIEPLRYAVLETRGGASTGVQVYRDAMLHYVGGKYDQASVGLKEAIHRLEDGEGDDLDRHLDQARLYLGISLLMERRAAEAREPLTLAARSSLPVLADRAQWYLAQTALLLEDADAAAAHLQRLAGSPGFGDRAERQLQAIRTRQLAR